MRDQAKAAYQRALDAQQYQINSGGASRSITRQDLDKLYQHWQRLESEVAKLESQSPRTKFIVPRH
jgi:hypothetical protein